MRATCTAQEAGLVCRMPLRSPQQIRLPGFVRSFALAKLSPPEVEALHVEVERLSVPSDRDRVAPVPPVAVALVRQVGSHPLWLWWRRAASSDALVLVAVTRIPPPQPT